jgi:hypothetical protein
MICFDSYPSISILTMMLAALPSFASPSTISDGADTNAKVEKTSLPDGKAEEGAAEKKSTDESAQGADSVGDIFSELKPDPNADSYITEKKKKADEYFRRGVLLYEGKDYANAAEAFQIAYETLPHPAVLGNIAMCYDRAGKIPEAVTYYRLYLKDPVNSNRDNAMTTRLSDLSALVADIHISCNNNCQIRVDGINRGISDSQVVVMPGQHRIEGVIDEKILTSQMITVQAREAKTAELTLPLPTPPVPPVIFVSPTKPSAEPNPISNEPLFSGGFWFGSGMTVVSLSLVTAFGAMTLSQKADYSASGWTDSESKDRGERYRTVTNAMIGLTGASAAATILFAISDVTRHRKKKSAAKETVSAAGAGIAISF